MEITRIHAERACLLALSGRLDGRNPGVLEKKLAEELQTNNRVLLDLNRVGYIDSTGLGVLVGGLRKAINKGGDIRLINPSDEVRMLMELTRVDKVFLIFSDQKIALKSYSDDETEQFSARSSK